MAARGRKPGQRVGPDLVSNPRTAFGKLLSEMRVAKDLTVRELAERIGMSPAGGGSIPKYERGDLYPPMPVEILLDWTHAMGYDDQSPEVRQLLELAYQEHRGALDEAFGRYIDLPT